MGPLQQTQAACSHGWRGPPVSVFGPRAGTHVDGGAPPTEQLLSVLQAHCVRTSPSSRASYGAAHTLQCFLRPPSQPPFLKVVAELFTSYRPNHT